MSRIRTAAVLAVFGALGCEYGPPTTVFVPPDGGPVHADAWIWTIGRRDSVSGNDSWSFYDHRCVLGGELPAGIADERSVLWEFVARRDGQDLYRVCLVEGTELLADVQVLYAGGHKTVDVGGIPVHIADQTSD